MTFLRKLGSCLKDRVVTRKGAGLFLLLLVVGFGLFHPGTSFAVDADGVVSASETVTLFLASITMRFVDFLGNVTTLITEVVLVNVMSYNGFGSSSVIGAGWALLRDLVNLGFVIALLLIAVLTIFGGSVGSWSVQWSKEIPKLLGFSILVNFSRTICVLLIDVGQVIMLTFVNAVKDIAGGNIISMFGLADFLTLDRDKIAQLVANNAGVDPGQMLSSALLALGMMILVLGVMIILTVVLVSRIVVLWVLVVLSPVAFFFGGADILSHGPGGGVYGKWWSQFSNAVAIGPVLVFFLWLTLSVAGAGNIAATEAFPLGAVSGQVEEAVGFATKIAEPGRLLSFIIALAMMMVGFQVAGEMAGSVGGIAEKAVKGGVKGAFKIGAGAAAVAGVGSFGAAHAAGLKTAAWTGVGLKAGLKTGQLAKNTKAMQTARGALEQGLLKTGQKMPGWLGGRVVSRVGTSLEQARSKEQGDLLKTQTDATAGYTTDQLKAETNGRALTPEGSARQLGAMLNLLTDKDKRNELTEKEQKDFVERVINSGGVEAFENNEDAKKKWKELRKTRPDMFPPAEFAKILSDMKEEEEFMALDPKALENPDVQAKAKTITRFEQRARKVLGADGKPKKDENGNDIWQSGEMSLFELLQEGRIGTKDQKQAFNDSVRTTSVTDPKKVNDTTLRTMDTAHVTETYLRDLQSEAGSRPGETKLDFILQNPKLDVTKLSGKFVEDFADVLGRVLSPDRLRALMASANGADFRKGAENALRTGSYGGTGSVSEDESRKRQLQVALLVSARNDVDLHSAGFLDGGNNFEASLGTALKNAIKKDPSFVQRQSARMGTDARFRSLVAQTADVGSVIRESRTATGPDRDAWHEVMEHMEREILARLPSITDDDERKAQQKRARSLRAVLDE